MDTKLYDIEYAIGGPHDIHKEFHRRALSEKEMRDFVDILLAMNKLLHEYNPRGLQVCKIVID